MNNLIRETREKAGLTQRALAEAVGISQRHLAKLENQLSLAKIDVAWRIADRLNAELQGIFPELQDFPQIGKLSRLELVELHYDSSALRTFASSGVDLDPATWTLKFRLRGGATVSFVASKADAMRLRGALSDRPSNNAFYVFYSSEVAVAINLEHLVHYYELWDAHTPHDWHDDQLSFEAVSVYLSDSPHPLSCDAEPDEGAPTPEDDDGQLRHLLFLVQTYVEPGEFLSIDDVDGETAFFRAADVALFAIPLHYIDERLANDLHEAEYGPEDGEPRSVDPE